MSGFTLFEILVSISIFAVLATMVYSSLMRSCQKMKRSRGATAGFEMAKNTMNRISMDLTTAFL
jgi:prepilin-type N-terminal cleavage/methylation domain-containing protein